MQYAINSVQCTVHNMHYTAIGSNTQPETYSTQSTESNTPLNASNANITASNTKLTEYTRNYATGFAYNTQLKAQLHK